MKRKKLIEQLKKLRNLAERGATEHERDAAQRMYDTICRTHDITPDELVDVREVRFFDVKTEHDRKLLVQIVCAVLDLTDFSVWKQGRKRNKLGFELTEAEFVKIERMYRIYRADFRKQIDRAYRAFVEANRIYPATAHSGHSDELTAEEYEELKQAFLLSEVMTKSRVDAELRGNDNEN